MIRSLAVVCVAAVAATALADEPQTYHVARTFEVAGHGARDSKVPAPAFGPPGVGPPRPGRPMIYPATSLIVLMVAK